MGDYSWQMHESSQMHEFPEFHGQSKIYYVQIVRTFLMHRSEFHNSQTVYFWGWKKFLVFVHLQFEELPTKANLLPKLA